MANNYGMSDILVAFSQKYNGDFFKVYKALTAREKISDHEIQRLIKKVDEKYTTVLFKNYPSSFKDDLVCPPIVMYYEGNLNLFEKEHLQLCNPFDENKRFFLALEPCSEGMDYVIGCENQNDLAQVLEYVIEHHPEINFVNYRTKDGVSLMGNG